MDKIYRVKKGGFYDFDESFLTQKIVVATLMHKTKMGDTDYYFETHFLI